jgi:hypothetical protein
LQLRNQIGRAIELSKPGKFGPLLGGFEGSFAFSRNFNYALFGQNPQLIHFKSKKYEVDTKSFLKM